MWTIDWSLAWTLLSRIGIAALLGGLIGLERQKAHRNAGLRTHILISLGAALVMCTGEYVFATYSAHSNIDPARLGAQVVSGIGILCAGTIMKAGSGIRGLTTATGLWCSACIGLAAGSGNLIPAAGTAVIAVIVLWFFRYLEEQGMRKSQTETIKILLSDTGTGVQDILSWMDEQGFPVDTFRFEREQDHRIALTCSILFHKSSSYSELALGLSGMDFVVGVEKDVGE